MSDQIDGALPLDRRDFLKAAAAASTVGLAGCLGSADAKGTLATEVSDQPGDIGDFESCVVTIAGIWLKPTGDGGGGTAAGTPTDQGGSGGTPTGTAGQGDGRTYYEFDEPQRADLVDLQGENTQLVDEQSVPARTYAFLQLDVTGVEGVLDGGESAEVDTPGNAPLQFEQSFEVREGERTTFVADFTPVRRGKTGRYLLQPVASETEVVYEDAEGE